MKVKPMIFNTAMVKALLDGRKTQTRRPVKHQPFFSTSVIPSWVFPRNKAEVSRGDRGLLYPNAKSSVLALSGYSPGDLIYVRERFCIGGIDETDREHPNDRQQFVHQDAPSHPIPYEACIRKAILIDDVVWKPSIHMPRSASRITLKVTGVRVERVQNISESDAIAEGFSSSLHHLPAPHIGSVGNTAVAEFSEAWQEIYGDHWENNEWCWVIDFEVIQKNIDHYIALQEAA